MVRKPRLGLIGAGNMGTALASSWAEHGLIAQSGWLVIADPSPSPAAQALVKRLNIPITPALDKDQASLLETVVLAVKPQMMATVAAQLNPVLPANTLLISIAAGVTLSRLAELFGVRPLVRAMPNTPAAIGRGATAFVASANTPREACKRARTLLGATGMAEQVAEEKALDAITAVSGSGPAYVFLLAEAMMAAAMAEGLAPELAQKLVCETVAGSGELLRQRGCDPAQLRAEVTSPGGTTAAALDVLMGEGNFAELMRRAVNNATRRSAQLGAQS